MFGDPILQNSSFFRQSGGASAAGRAAGKAKMQKKLRIFKSTAFGADDEARTRYLHLGKVALYQMSYVRVFVFRNVDYYSVSLSICQAEI